MNSGSTIVNRISTAPTRSSAADRSGRVWAAPSSDERGTKEHLRRLAGAAALLPAFWTATALAAPLSEPPDSTVAAAPVTPATSGSEGASAPRSVAADGRASAFARATPPDDPTGGAYTTPTLLFIPAGAVPAWNARLITSIETQGPTAADRLASGTSVGFRPGLGAELGLPGGFTLGGGTMWVGGDTSPTPISGGLGPYFQLRLRVLGKSDGRGFQLGTSATYKFVGFQGDPGEMEWAVSGQYRQRAFEIGLQGVIGKDFATADADGELHAYAVYRPISQLALGGASQVRMAVVSQPGETTYDVIGGVIVSVTLDRWQIAGLGGETTAGRDQSRVGALGQIFGTARF
jgi:hypothetical protein